MVEAGRGTILLTGATAGMRGGPKFALLACPKFALRALSQSIAREFQPQVSLPYLHAIARRVWHPCLAWKMSLWEHCSCSVDPAQLDNVQTPGHDAPEA